MVVNKNEFDDSARCWECGEEVKDFWTLHFNKQQCGILALGCAIPTTLLLCEKCFSELQDQIGN